MVVNLIALGLIYDIVGVLILVSIGIIDPPHQKIFNQKEWWKKYRWEVWIPIFPTYPPSEKVKWNIKWDYIVSTYGFIPPKHLWNVIGFLFVLAGFILQLKFYLS